MLKIITQQLAKILPQNHVLQKNQTIDPTNFNKLNKLLNSIIIKEICVFDATMSMKIKKNEIIQVRDHINSTGTNILIGKQKKLCIDFTDLTNLYEHNQNGVITECYGEILNTEKEFPSHYLCHITTLARAMGFNKITGYLYNTIEKPIAIQ